MNHPKDPTGHVIDSGLDDLLMRRAEDDDDFGRRARTAVVDDFARLCVCPHCGDVQALPLPVVRVESPLVFEHVVDGFAYRFPTVACFACARLEVKPADHDAMRATATTRLDAFFAARRRAREGGR